MFSRNTCSSSIDDDALAIALQAVGDCTLSADCLTSYNQYYGGWATVVDGKIVVGDLTKETQAKFSQQYYRSGSLLASVSWYSTHTDGYSITKYVPWEFDASDPDRPTIEQKVLNGFTLATFSGCLLYTSPSPRD